MVIHAERIELDLLAVSALNAIKNVDYVNVVEDRDMGTTFENKCVILGELWLNYRNDEAFEDFIEYNDLGLPLAYSISEGIVMDVTPAAEKYVLETFDVLLSALNIEDEVFENLDELLVLAEENNG